jgi:2-amino-4-hydroxy-6-hydroxymethyldihydropteridine diphosphokinase
VETELPPEALLQACKRVEAELGRDFAQVRHGPRVVDVDLLLLGDLEHRSELLTLPHRDVLSRRFVLVPLLELDPDLALPDGRRLADALDRLKGQRVERVGVL